ncbi:MAG: hypothetical protein IKH26_11645 [Bacteroidaceae bacterium]|nr:hypothetical protein [Bacteroidaceae bacterium]
MGAFSETECTHTLSIYIHLLNHEGAPPAVVLMVHPSNTGSVMGSPVVVRDSATDRCAKSW